MRGQGGSCEKDPTASSYVYSTNTVRRLASKGDSCQVGQVGDKGGSEVQENIKIKTNAEKYSKEGKKKDSKTEKKEGGSPKQETLSFKDKDLHGLHAWTTK